MSRNDSFDAVARTEAMTRAGGRRNRVIGVRSPGRTVATIAVVTVVATWFAAVNGLRAEIVNAILVGTAVFVVGYLLIAHLRRRSW